MAIIGYDNTNMIGGFPTIAQYIRRRGLAGLGATDQFGVTVPDDPTATMTTIRDAVTGAMNLINYQQLYQINLQRAQQGLPIINPAMVTPEGGVAVGFSQQLQDTLIPLGLLVLAGIWLSTRKRH